MSLIVKQSTPLSNPLTRHARETKPFRCYKGNLRCFTATFNAHYPKGTIEHVPASVPGSREMWVGRDESVLGVEPGKGRVVALYRPQDPIPGVYQEFQLIPFEAIGFEVDAIDMLAFIHADDPDALKPGGELHEMIRVYRMKMKGTPDGPDAVTPGSTQTNPPLYHGNVPGTYVEIPPEGPTYYTASLVGGPRFGTKEHPVIRRLCVSRQGAIHTKIYVEPTIDQATGYYKLIDELPGDDTVGTEERPARYEWREPATLNPDSKPRPNPNAKKPPIEILK
ncbi:hypothetical protein Aura_00167 [Pseudomonas phage vB_PpuM-Aura]